MMPQVSNIATGLFELLRTADGAYSPRTLKGYDADLRCFIAWCRARSCRWLPAEADTVADFIDSQVKDHCLFDSQTPLMRHRLRTSISRFTGADGP